MEDTSVSLSLSVNRSQEHEHSQKKVVAFLLTNYSLHRSTGNIKDVNKAYGTFILTETENDKRRTVLSDIGSGIGLGIDAV